MARGKRAGGPSTLVEPRVKEFKRSVRRIQALMDEAPIGICNVDLKGKITYVNQRFEEVSGYSGEEVVGKNGFKLGIFSNETIKLLAKRMKDRLTGRPPRLLETQFKCKDGHWIWVAIEGKIIREGGIPVGFQIISRDITELKRAEEALRESREQLRKMFESITDGISVVDLNGVITEVNQRTVEIHGFSSKDELLGKNAFELVAPRDHERIAKNMRQALKEGIVRGVEYTLLKADGTEFPGELSTSMLMDASGNWVGHITIARDITERKRMEQALRESEEKFSKAFRSSPTDSVTLSRFRDGLFLEVNDSFLRTTGYTREEVINHTSTELGIWAKAEDRTRMVQMLKKEGRVHNEEFTFRMKSGEMRESLFSAELIDLGGEPCVISMTIDISELRKTERALERQEAYFQQLFDNSPDAIAWLDTADRFVSVNKGFETLFGYGAGEIKGRLISDTIVPEDRREEASALSQARSSNKAVRTETVRKRKDGSLVDVSLLAYPILLGNKAVGAYVIYTDITGRKRAEAKLKEAQEKLIRSERLAAIGQLASGVGHELRNPLGAIKNAVLYIRRRITRSELMAYTEPKVLEFLDLIDEEIDSANKVITDLLSFSRVAKPAVSLVNVGSIVKDALNHVAMSENVELTTDVDPSLPLVMVDASQIRQVFINVILNALEAMPEGGRFEIRAKSKTEFVMVEFTDTGCGIPESVAGKIFDPLFTTKPKGVGLGLAMSRSIIERHGGDIGVKSKEGKGTTFTLSLPVRVV